MIIFAVTTCMNFVSAENETNILRSSESEEEVLASEDGHVNITFDNGYNGYCINYGEHEAKTGQEYSVKDTKHTIWHFTDDFNGWRIDPLLIENIKSTASTKTIPDSGAVRQINNTTEAVFDFQVLSSDKSGHQNFFAYKITYRDIVKEIIANASGSNDTSSEYEKNITNTTENNRTHEKAENISNASENNKTHEKTENISNASENTTLNEKQKNTARPTQSNGKTAPNNTQKVSKENVSKSISLSKHVTGKRTIGIIMLLILLGIVAIKYIRRD